MAYPIKVTVTDDDGGVGMDATSVLVKNVAPTVNTLPVTMIDEGGLAELNFSITDPGTEDTYEVEVDWGDGSVEIFSLPAGDWNLSLNHQYLDDMPTGPAEVAYPIKVTVTDDDGGVGMDSTSVLVKNVAPGVHAFR